MIRGYYVDPRRRPFVDGRFQFSALNNLSANVRLLVDTGADRTILSIQDAERIGIDITVLPQSAPGRGVGAQVPTRVIEAVFTIENFSTLLTLPIPEMPHAIPSLLGRDILAHFALFMEERTQRVLLLAPDEADALRL
jgi:predicted aspartyl protease